METNSNQQVLAVPAQDSAWLYKQRKFYDDNASNLLSFALDHGRFVDRKWAEKTKGVKQLIGCAIIANGHKILCARRARKNSRSALALRWTMMFGGHVDELDRDAKNPIVNCILREIAEELGVYPDSEPEFLGLAVDPATDVGRHHIGVVFLVRTNIAHVVVHRGLDSAEFVNSKKRHFLHFRDSNEIVRLLRAGKLDPWSELFFSSEKAEKLMNLTYRSQSELDLIWC